MPAPPLHETCLKRHLRRNPVEPEKGLFIMQEFKAYAASRAKGPLEPFSFTPGPLGPEEVEIKVLTRG